MSQLIIKSFVNTNKNVFVSACNRSVCLSLSVCLKDCRAFPLLSWRRVFPFPLVQIAIV